MPKLLELTKGHCAIVDDIDHEYLSRWKWTYSGGYALRKEIRDGKVFRVMLHRQIMQAPDGYDVDHKDRNGLNNCRCNLRISTRSQNSANRIPSTGKTSVYKGVSFRRDRKTSPWRTHIGHQGQKFHVGAFSTEIEAAQAYDKVAKELFGEFARTNF